MLGIQNSTVLPGVNIPADGQGEAELGGAKCHGNRRTPFIRMGFGAKRE